MTGGARWTGVSCQRLAAGEDVLRGVPFTLEGAVPEIFAQEAALYARSPERELYVVSGGRVDAQGLCTNRWAGRIDWNARSLPVGRTSGGLLWRPGRLLARSAHRARSVLALTHPEQRGYFHWLFDVLPRYAMARDSGQDFDAVYLDQSQPFQRETWSMLCERRPVIDAAQVSCVQAKRLLVPSAPSVSGVMPSWVCQWLRANLAVHGTSTRGTGRRRLYLSRDRAARGRVANEAAVTAVLAGHGFETLYAEELSVAEQIDRFANAEFVVGPHGAGLSNLVFAPESCAVIELFARSHLNLCYWTLSSQRGLRYGYLAGPDGPATGHGVRPDMVVDTAALDQLVRKLLDGH